MLHGHLSQCTTMERSMISLPPISNAASAILTQALDVAAKHPAQADTSSALIAVASGARPTQAETSITTSHATLSAQLFSLDRVDITKVKMQLFERVGEALGVKLKEFANFDDFAKQVEIAYRDVLRDDGILAIKAIEREAGLDELNLSLKDVVDSMKNPEKNDRVSKALEEKYNLQDQDKDDAVSNLHVNWL